MMFIRPEPLAMGDPGIFGSIGRAIGGVARGVINVGSRFVPGGGIVRTVANRVLPGGGTKGGLSAADPRGRPRPGLRGTVQRFLPGGETGFLPRRPRMNVANVKAGRRAIRRIKGLRKLLQSIEKELPRRPAVNRGGSRGVITQAEARRALNQ